MTARIRETGPLSATRQDLKENLDFRNFAPVILAIDLGDYKSVPSVFDRNLANVIAKRYMP